jgi:hypothetical protein
VPTGPRPRAIRRMIDAALRALGPALGVLYSREPAPVPPKQLLRALLLPLLYLHVQHRNGVPWQAAAHR